jgi:hypothetical protein
MGLAKNNHYNPCFWTAFWNRTYYEAVVNGLGKDLKARDQKVYVLNIISEKIYESSVNNVHYEKNLSPAKITYEDAIAFCKKYHPDKFDEFFTNTNRSQYPVYLDIEDMFTYYEGRIGIYKTLINVICRQKLGSLQEKTYLAGFILIQMLRSPATMNKMLSIAFSSGASKFEYFLNLQWAMSDFDVTSKIVTPWIFSKWILYKTIDHVFPLSDTPIMMDMHSIMVVLSPRLLLEIEPHILSNPKELSVNKQITTRKLKEFQSRTIRNTFREIIFNRIDLLEKWKRSAEFRQRVKEIQEMKGQGPISC